MDSLDSHEVGESHSAGDFRRGDDGSRGTIGYPAAIEKAKWLCDNLRVEYLLHRHFLANVRLGGTHSVTMAFPRNMGHGLF